MPGRKAGLFLYPLLSIPLSSKTGPEIIDAMNSGPQIDDLPRVLHLLPLDVLLLPEGTLPILLTDSWFSNLILTAAETVGYAGVIQLRETGDAGPRFQSVGCLARLSGVERVAEGVRVTLEGVVRFRVREELGDGALPQAAVDYQEFAHDLGGAEEDLSGWNLEGMKAMLVEFGRQRFGTAGILEAMTPKQVLRFLAQTAPFSTAERQALLEARGFKDLLDILAQLLALNFLTTTPDAREPHVN